MSKPTRHSPPKGKRRPKQELLYDPEVPTPTHAELARTLVQSAASGTLCTLSVEPEGFPYGSLVTFAIHDGDPILPSKNPPALFMSSARHLFINVLFLVGVRL